MIPTLMHYGFVKSPKVPFFVIPAEAGIQSFQALLDSRLSTLRSRATAEDGRGSDGCGDFLRDRQPSIIPCGRHEQHGPL